MGITGDYRCVQVCTGVVWCSRGPPSDCECVSVCVSGGLLYCTRGAGGGAREGCVIL